jgi:hypothetical protein
MTAEVLAAVLLASLPGPEQPCQVDDCLSRLRARVEIQLALVEAPVLAGHWTEGPGLTGGELYLFEDGTYISTEWGCVLPETIQDKGHWKLDASVLNLEPDSDVTWSLQRGSNRRYAVLSLGGTMRLLGLDWSLEVFEELAADEPNEWLEVLSLSQAKRWKGTQGRRRKAELLKMAWRPTYYHESGEAAER